MITVGVGFTGGAALVGFIAAWLIPAFGWNPFSIPEAPCRS